MLGAFGDPGHAFPMIALGRALVQRGHRVVLQTWVRWEADVRALGIEFSPAPEYPPFPTQERPLQPYAAAERAAREMDPLLAEERPDVVVHDVLTIAPALAAEVRGIVTATLIPHIHPMPERGWPPFSIGARRPRSGVGRAVWSALSPITERGLELGRTQLNERRRRLALPAVDRLFGTVSEQLALVATFPALEYPRRWPAHTRVVGPLLWEPPSAVETLLPAGGGPLVVIAPSTSQDSRQRLVRAALAAGVRLGVRVLAVAPRGSVEAPPGASVVDWMSYAAVMPHAAVVVTHGGHGTVARALACGCVPVVVPGAGDQAEMAARVDWAGLGVRVPPRLCTPRVLELAIERALRDGERAARVAEVASWWSAHDPPADAAAAVEELAGAVDPVRNTN